MFGLAVRGEWAWYWLVGGSLLLTVWLALNLIESPIGRALRAIHGAEIAAATAGVDTTRYKVLVFVLSAVIASFAGSLFAHYTGFLTPDEATFFRSIEFVTMVVLGGLASVFGAVVGAAILTALPQFLTVFHDYEQVVFGLVLMLVMIFLPRGLVPSLLGTPLVSLLRVEALAQDLRRRPGGARSVLRARGGPHPVDHRPQRRRQDHALQPDQRRARPGCRPHLARRPGRHRAAELRARARRASRAPSRTSRCSST